MELLGVISGPALRERAVVHTWAMVAESQAAATRPRWPPCELHNPQRLRSVCRRNELCSHPPDAYLYILQLHTQVGVGPDVASGVATSGAGVGHLELARSQTHTRGGGLGGRARHGDSTASGSQYDAFITWQ